MLSETDYAERIKKLSNDELLDQLDYCGYDPYYKMLFTATINEIRKRLNKKSVVKKAKWEIYMISYFDGEGCRCSLCGTEGEQDYDYCPGCGAKMKGY